jgi:dolichyl-phosphate beta-glucosyltransferase
LVQLDSNKGKGAAVRMGMLAAQGDRCLLTDADLSTPIEDIDALQAALDQDTDIAIGSRALKQSRIEQHQPWHREMLGKIFNIMVRVLYLPGIKDTQCGFKLFKHKAVQDVFQEQKIEGFVFDVEVLWLAQKLGYTIQEVPVRWSDSAATKLTSNVTTALTIWRDLFRIRRLHPGL